MLRAAIAALPYLRAQAGHMMRDTVTLAHADDVTLEWDDDNRYSSVTDAAAYYEGPGEVREPSSGDAQRLAGEEEVPGTSWQGRVPFTVAGVAEGDLLTVVASPDPDLVDASFRVTLDPPSANRTARRLSLRRNG